MNPDTAALLSDLELRLGELRRLLVEEDPDPQRILAGLAAIDAVVLPVAPGVADEGMRSALERCQVLQAEVLAQARAHRERLVTVLTQLGHASAATRTYGQTGTAAPLFIDRSQ